MTEEQRKWYAMGANDMEAGRLVTRAKNEGPGGCVPWEEVESLRAVVADQAQRAEAAEARLAEVGKAKLTEYQRGYRAGHWEGLHEPQYPVSFTDEDVERVAEAVRGAAPTFVDGMMLKGDARTVARAALSAYLEPTTKGDA